MTLIVPGTSNARRLARRIGGSLRLLAPDVTAQAYTATNAAFAPGAGSFAAFVWIRFDGPSLAQSITHQVVGYHNASYADGWMVTQYGRNFYVYAKSAGAVLNLTEFFAGKTTSTWNRLGFVANASDYKIRGYWNGVLIGTSGVSAWDISATERVYAGVSAQLQSPIGANLADLCYHVGGTALTDEQARQDFDGVVQPNLIGRWKFDETYGSTTALDSSGNGRNMSLAGSAALCGEAVM